GVATAWERVPPLVRLEPDLAPRLDLGSDTVSLHHLAAQVGFDHAGDRAVGLGQRDPDLADVLRRVAGAEHEVFLAGDDAVVRTDRDFDEVAGDAVDLALDVRRDDRPLGGLA